MLNTLFTGASSPSATKDRTSAKKQLPMLFVTPAVSTRQQSSIDAHVQRMRSAAASSPAAILKGIQSTHDRSSNADGQAPSEVSQSDRYRSLFGRPVDIVRNMLKTSPVQDVEPAASIVDTESAAETCSEDSKSDSGYQSDSGSEGSIESSATSILDSDSESLAYLPEIAEVSICNDAEREDLRKQLDHSQHQLYLQQIEYRDLDEKYKVQIAQRKADHATVMDAYTRFENAQAYSRQLEQQRKAIIQVNDRKTSRLECNHRAAISAMARAHRMELKIQNDTIAKLHAELSAKDEVLAQVKVVSVTAVEARITALVNELDQKDRKIQEMKAANTIKDNTIEQAEAVKDKVQLKLREMVEAAEMNRKTWAEEKEKLSSNAYQARLDHQDSLQAQQVEIVRLTRDNHRLELEKNALSMTVSQHRDEEFTCLRDTFNECETMRKELATANREIIILKEKDENILESMQQERDYWEKNYEKEKIAQDECRQLQIKLFVAQESIEHRDDRIRDLEADLQASRNPARNSGDRLDTVQKLVLDNDELRAKIDMLEQEKADIQKALDMKDNENFGIICNAHVQEAELRKLKASHDILQYTYSAAEQEKYYLRAAIRRGEGGGGLTQEQRDGLVDHLERLTDENKKLANEMWETMEERDELLKNKESVEAKAQNNVDEWRKQCNYMQAAYWDYAVHKVDKLQRELDLKNGKVPPEEQTRPESNPRVAD